MLNLCTEQLGNLRFHKVFVCMCIHIYIHTYVFIYLYKRHRTFIVLCNIRLTASPHLIGIFWIFCPMFAYLWFQNDSKWSYWTNFPKSESSDWRSGKLIAEDWVSEYFRKWDPYFSFLFLPPHPSFSKELKITRGRGVFHVFPCKLF